MDGKLLARVGAIALAAVSIAAATIEATRPPARHESQGVRPRDAAGKAVGEIDPLREALARCQALGPAAAEDASCFAAWSENRQRFFAREPRKAEPGGAVAGSDAAASSLEDGER